MKIGMIFPGYSSQYIGMGKELYDDFRVIQEYFEEAYNCLNSNFIKLCFASSDSELSKATNAYTSIFLISSAIYALLNENGIKPNMVAGHGIGYYTAIHAANGVTFPDGLYLLKKFATFYEELLPSLDVDVLKINGITSLRLKKLLNNSLKISIYNNDLQNLVSGNKEEINSFKDLIKQEFKIKAQKIDPSIGLFSELMDSVVEQFEVYLEKVDFKDTTIPVISAIDGKEILLGKKIKNYIIKQISSPVRWNKVMEKFEDMDLIIEIGPGSILSELMKEKYPNKKIISLNNKADFEEIKNIISLEQNSVIPKENNVAQQQFE